MISQGEEPVVGANVYCTIFDADYLTRAVALHASLVRGSPSARLAFFCLDDAARQALDALGLERAIVVPHEAFAPPELLALRPQRSRAEYCFTCKGFALQYLARIAPEAPWLIYVDTDMMFYGDPDSALPGGHAHYLLTPHRFHPAFEHFAARVGRFNAGYFAARNSAPGLEAVRWWTARCVESCSAVMAEDAYADQMYLDRLPATVPGAALSEHPGLNAAPWNIERYRISAREAGVWLDDAPLLLYHFQGLRVLNRWLVDLYAGERRVGWTIRELIYKPYLRELRSAARLVRARLGLAPSLGNALVRSPAAWLRLAQGLAHGAHNPVVFRLAA